MRSAVLDSETLVDLAADISLGDRKVRNAHAKKWMGDHVTNAALPHLDSAVAAGEVVVLLHTENRSKPAAELCRRGQSEYGGGPSHYQDGPLPPTAGHRAPHEPHA